MTEPTEIQEKYSPLWLPTQVAYQITEGLRASSANGPRPGSPAMGSPVEECIPVGPHCSRLPYPPVFRIPPFNSSYPRNLGPKRFQCFHPNFQMSSYALMDTGLQMPQELAQNVRNQRTQYPLVPTGFPTQSSLQRHPDLTSNLDHQMSQSFLLPGGSQNQTHLERHLGFQSKQNLYIAQRALEAQATTKPPSLQWYSEYQRYQVPQVSFGSSSKPCVRMDPDLGGNSSLPTSRTNPVHSIPHRPSSSSERSDNYSEVHLSTPKQKKRRRIKYSEEQNRQLQEYFDECMYPSKEQRTELAQNLGVTDCQIQIWFKNRRAKYKHKNLQNVSEPLGNMESPKDVDESTSSHGSSSVLDSVTGESMSSGTSCVDSVPHLEETLHIEQGSEGARHDLQEDVCDGQAAVAAAAGSGNFLGRATQNDPAVAECASTEAKRHMEAEFQQKDGAEDTIVDIQELWKEILEDHGITEDVMDLITSHSE